MSQEVDRERVFLRYALREEKKMARRIGKVSAGVLSLISYLYLVAVLFSFWKPGIAILMSGLGFILAWVFYISLAVAFTLGFAMLIHTHCWPWTGLEDKFRRQFDKLYPPDEPEDSR